MPLETKIFEAFQRQIGLSISFHDYSKKLSAFIDGRYIQHQSDFCKKVKKNHNRFCFDFDVRCVQTFLPLHTDGFFKICHAGIAECVLPLREGHTLLGVMFIGPFKPDSSIRQTKPLLLSPKTITHMELPLDTLRLTEKNAADFFTIAGAVRTAVESAIAGYTSTDAALSSEDRIRDFIRRSFTSDIHLADVARHSFLSVSRTGHLIKELFKETFPKVLNRFRVDHAKTLLTRTDFTVTEVALRCGYSDAAYFHKIFKSGTGITPAAYRDAYRQQTDI